MMAVADKEPESIKRMIEPGSKSPNGIYAVTIP